LPWLPPTAQISMGNESDADEGDDIHPWAGGGDLDASSVEYDDDQHRGGGHAVNAPFQFATSVVRVAIVAVDAEQIGHAR